MDNAWGETERGSVFPTNKPRCAESLGFWIRCWFHGSRSTQPTTLPTAIGLWGEVGQDARPTGIGVPLEWKVRVLDGRGTPSLRKNRWILSIWQLVLSNVSPPITEDNHRRGLLSGHHKGLPPGDCYISRIAGPSNRFELPVIGEDNRGDVAANAVKCEQVAHTAYP